MKARGIIAMSVLVGISFSSAKTRMLVEDPNNPVVGRYSIAAKQAQRATVAAETFLASDREDAIQKAYAIRYSGFWSVNSRATGIFALLSGKRREHCELRNFQSSAGEASNSPN